MAKSTPKMQSMPSQKAAPPAKGGGPDKIPSKSGAGSGPGGKTPASSAKMGGKRGY